MFYSDHLTKAAQNQPENTTLQGAVPVILTVTESNLLLTMQRKRNVLGDASVRIKLAEQGYKMSCLSPSEKH